MPQSPQIPVVMSLTVNGMVGMINVLDILRYICS